MNRDHLHKLATKYAQAYCESGMAPLLNQNLDPALMREETAFNAMAEYVETQIAEARRENR